MTNLVRVKVDTVDGTAEEGTDYRGIHTTIEFQPGQTELEIEMEIIDDDDWEPDEEFFLKITLDPNSEDSGVAKIGKRHIMTIKILNDDLPGTFQFERRAYFVKESCGEAEIVIIREFGADGNVEVRLGQHIFVICNQSPTTDTAAIPDKIQDQRQNCKGRKRLQWWKFQTPLPFRGN